MAPDLAARYARAEARLPHHMRTLMTSPLVSANWIGGSDTFWYRTDTPADAAYVVVDAVTGTRRSVADMTEIVPPSVGRPGEALSPDGRWAVIVRDHNVFLRDTSTDEVRQLTSDGVDGHAYAGMPDQVAFRVMHENLGIEETPQVVWSTDSSRFVTHRLDQRDVEMMHLVRSSPFDGSRPKLISYRYGLVGDEYLPTAELFVFEAVTGESVQAKCEPIFMPFVPAIAYGWVWWSHDQSSVYWLANDRGDHHVRLSRMDADTGEVAVLVEEHSASHINYGPQQMDRNVRVLSTGEVLWWSQRSGWGHLYLYDTEGSVTTLTSGDWLVRHVVLVDEEARRVVFTAGGFDPNGDPYVQQLCSVSLDGGEVTAITGDNLDHDAQPSPSGRFFVDVTSRWDTPSVSVLRDRAGDVVMELERCDTAALYASGWTPPERVVVKAADGVTDIWCNVYTPSDFDPDASYPVLDAIYPGPQLSSAPVRFPQSGGPLTAGAMAFNYPESFAELGFVVVVVDGRGSALRSKDFQDQARRSGDGIFVDDHVAAITRLAVDRPWMDLDRVGIYGYSAGGYASTRAILQAPDFFKVAVSAGGNHDNRINHSWWGEKFFGLADDFDFERQANVSLVDNLKGKLFLIHGEMDDNATPHGTMRLVDALIAANKDFDLLIVPNADHHMMVHREYFIRRRWDYVVQHLRGESPPAYQLAPIPIDSPVDKRV